MYRQFLAKITFNQSLKPCLQRMLFALFFLFMLGCSTAPLQESRVAQPFFPSPALGLQAITSFDVTVEQSIIHLIVAGTVSASDKHTQVRYLSSGDGGRRWTVPVTISTNAPAPIASRGNDIQLSVAGQKLLALWQAQGELPGMGPIVSVYSVDAGKSWAAGTNPAPNASGDQSHLDLGIDQHGTFHAVWLEDPEENGYQSLRYAKTTLDLAGTHWDGHLALDSSTCSCCWNNLLVSPLDEINVLYRDMRPRDMALMQSKDSGHSWQHRSTVGGFNWAFEGCPHVGGALAFADKPKPMLHSLVWTGAEGQQGLYYLRSDNNGHSWTAPYRLGNKAVHGDIAASKAGQVVAVWDEMQQDGSGIFMAPSDDGGTTWLATKPLSAKARLATHPRIVATQFGFLSLWTEKANKQPAQLALVFFNGSD
jgi:hypothetical protein